MTSDVKKADPRVRQTWASRASFILACLGYAIGLGNFWRFPYLMFKHGGAVFLIPYFLSLIFLGIPMTVLELTIGQMFQRGDIGVFRGIHPRLAGIGITSIWSGFVLLVYYVIIIAWAMVYMWQSIVSSPIPWSIEGQTTFCGTTDPASVYLYTFVIGS
jgi:SNF family Na+-dependent transporter